MPQFQPEPFVTATRANDGTLQPGDKLVNKKFKVPFITAFAVSVGAVLALTGAMTSGAAPNAGFMESRSMDGMNWMWVVTSLWMWIPVLVMLGFGGLLVWVTFTRKKRQT